MSPTKAESPDRSICSPRFASARSNAVCCASSDDVIAVSRVTVASSDGHWVTTWAASAQGAYPVGVAIATAFRESPRRIIVTYTISLIIWGFLFAYFKEGIIALIG